jgi:hypothetical protein
VTPGLIPEVIGVGSVREVVGDEFSTGIWAIKDSRSMKNLLDVIVMA